MFDIRHRKIYLKDAILKELDEMERKLEKEKTEGKTLQEIQDLYDNANEEGKQWMRENLHLWFGKDKPE